MYCGQYTVTWELALPKGESKPSGFIRTLSVNTNNNKEVLLEFYDSKLRLVREEYYDIEGKPLMQAEGYYSYEQKSDEHGSASSRQFFGTDGKPMAQIYGYTAVEHTYNEGGDLTSHRFFNGNELSENKRGLNTVVYDNQ